MPNPPITIIPLLPARHFARRWLKYVLLATGLMGGGLGIGIVGYHLFAGFNWIDSFLNASMILTGMGPVGTLDKTAAKIFASFYALFSGIVFLSGASVAVAPLFHRLLHRFHLQDTTRYHRAQERSQLAD
jgi:flagellar biosynthesis protein FliR